MDGPAGLHVYADAHAHVGPTARDYVLRDRQRSGGRQLRGGGVWADGMKGVRWDKPQFQNKRVPGNVTRSMVTLASNHILCVGKLQRRIVD